MNRAELIEAMLDALVGDADHPDVWRKFFQPTAEICADVALAVCEDHASQLLHLEGDA